MSKVTLEFLTEQLNLGEQLIAGRNSMFEPQDLPGRFGRVIREVDRVLAAIDCEAVVGGGWAVRVRTLGATSTTLLGNGGRELVGNGIKRGEAVRRCVRTDRDLRPGELAAVAD